MVWPIQKCHRFYSPLQGFQTFLPENVSFGESLIRHSTTRLLWNKVRRSSCVSIPVETFKITARDVRIHSSESIIDIAKTVESLVGVFKSHGYEANLNSTTLLNRAVVKCSPNRKEVWSFALSSSL